MYVAFIGRQLSFIIKGAETPSAVHHYLTSI